MGRDAHGTWRNPGGITRASIDSVCASAGGVYGLHDGQARPSRRPPPCLVAYPGFAAPFPGRPAHGDDPGSACTSPTPPAEALMRRLFVLAFIWGWSFLFIKVAGEGMTPTTVAWARHRARRGGARRRAARPTTPCAARPGVAAALRGGRPRRQHRALHAAGMGRAAHHHGVDRGAQRLDASVHRPLRRRRAGRTAAAGTDRGPGPGDRRRGSGGRRGWLGPRRIVDRRRAGGDLRGRRLRPGLRLHAAPPGGLSTHSGGHGPAGHRDRAPVPGGDGHVGRGRRVAHPHPGRVDPAARRPRHRRRVRPQLPDHRRPRRHQGVARHLHHPGGGRGRRHPRAGRAVRDAADRRRRADRRRDRRRQRQAAGTVPAPSVVGP